MTAWSRRARRGMVGRAAAWCGETRALVSDRFYLGPAGQGAGKAGIGEARALVSN
jgi:hypothetical protein